MKASAGTVRTYAAPTLPRIPDAAREKMTRESLVEAGIIAATVALTLFLSTALRLGLEQYTIGWF
jgi:hypothetical protein